MDRNLTVELNKNGVITSGTSHAKDKRPEVAIKMFTTAVAMASDIVGVFAKGFKIRELPKEGVEGISDIEKTALAILDRYRESLPGKLDEILEAGVKASGDLEKVHAKKKDLIVGDSGSGLAETPGQALATRLERLDAEEKKLLSFFGREADDTYQASFRIRPGASGTSCYRVLTLYSSGGIKTTAAGSQDEEFDPAKCQGYPVVGQDVETSDMVPVKFRNSAGDGNRKSLYVILKKDVTGAQGRIISRLENATGKSTEMGKTGESAGKDAKKGGFPYRVPALAKVYIVTAPEEENCTNGLPKELDGLGIHELQVAQFGTVLRLPAHTGNNDSMIVATYYEDTGALKKMATTSKAMEPSALDPFLTQVQATSSVIMESIKAKREAEATEAAEDKGYQALLKEVEWLELKLRKKNAAEGLGGTE